jgi:hypothetical protein
MASSRLRKEMLDLLERDLEFRYAVAGYFVEMLEGLESLEENMIKGGELNSWMPTYRRVSSVL